MKMGTHTFVWGEFLLTCNLNDFYSKLFCEHFWFAIQYVTETEKQNIKNINLIKKLGEYVMCTFCGWLAEIIFLLVRMNKRTHLQKKIKHWFGCMHRLVEFFTHQLASSVPLKSV